MALVTLIEATPWIAATGAPQTIRLAGGGRRAYDHLGYADWRAGIVEVPKFKSELGFGADGWTGATMAQNSDIRFHPSDPAVLADLAALFWNGCPVTVKSGDDDLAAPIWSTEFTGTIANVAEEGGALTFSVVDNSKKLDVPVTDARFAGTGGIEGDIGVEGRLKRRSWGRCWNVECRSLLAAYNIYEVGDPAFRLQAIDTVKDIGRAADNVILLGWKGSIAATLAALMDADVPEGGAVVAPSIACVRWWTQAILLTADIRGEIAGGYAETPAAIAARLAGLGGVTVANTAAMVAARPAPAGIHIGNEGETIAAAIDRLLLGASLLWYLGTDGAAVIGEWSFDLAPAASLKSVKVSRTVSYPPTKSRRVGYRRNERVHSAGEISAVILAADVTYADGRSVQSLQPDEPRATRGSPNGTNIGDIPVEVFISDLFRVVDDLSVTAPALFELTKAVGLLNDYMQAKTTLDGKPIGTIVVETREVGESNVATLDLIGAKNGAGTAFVLDTSTVMVSPVESIGAKFSSIDTNIGTATANVSFLMEAVVDTSGATIAKAVLSLKAGPAGSMRVSGIVATNDGAISTLDLDFDRTRIFRPDGELLFLADEDGVYMPNVEIDRVKINSVAVPVYASSSTSITGTGTSPTSFEGYTSTLTESITLPVAGTINIDAVVGLSFAGSPSVWQLQLLCDGAEVDVAGGVNSQEKVPLMAQIEKPAGTYSLQLKFGGHTLSTMYNRKLRATGHPYTG
ncbi:hypothetical protein HY78_00510 [Rhizorhabdus wittichii DC-6]|nr:hypothetical protein HY78_00510 [Rhizorhabdus wittichii DC-6]